MDNKKEDKDLIKELSDYTKYGFSLPEEFVFKQKKGLNRKKIIQISKIKNEPEWMLKLRLEAYDIFVNKKKPTWGADLSDLNFEDIVYYIKPIEKQRQKWEDLPESIKQTYDRLGVPEAERKFLAGVSAQYESEVVYHSLLKDLQDLGVIFTDMDTALKLHGDLVKKYFGKLVPASDNKFAALNTAVWSGGSFVYVPKGVKVSIPLQAYFRINAKNMGQFERTLIIAEEDSYVHYIEGCFLSGALVKTDLGYVVIEAIKKGDKVLTHKGRYQFVTKAINRFYTGYVYKIKLSHSDINIYVTENHPIFLVKRWKATKTENLNWFLAKDVCIGDYFVLPKYSSNTNNNFIEQELLLFELIESGVTTRKQAFSNNSNNFTNTIDLKTKFRSNINFTSIYTDLFYWFIGVVFSGIVNITNNSIVINLNQDNKNYIISKIKKLFKFNNLIYVQDGKIIINNIDFVIWFKNKILNNGLTYKLPNWILDLPMNQKLKIWEGLNDVFINSRNFFITGDLAFLLDLQLFLLSLNIKSKICKFQHDQYYLNINNFEDLIIDDNYLFSKVEEIEKFWYEGYVYNLSVNNDESYVANGFVSHNCTAPVYSTDSLHSAVVEIYCLPRSRVRYTTVQNWSKNVYNLVTKRAIAYENATMEWIDGNIGSKRTMKYPSIILQGEGAKGIVVSAAYAGKDQEQDTGTKIFHLASNTTSEVVAKSVSQDNGISTYRGIISVSPQARNCKISVKCDALLLDEDSCTKTIPVNIIAQEDVQLEHEATVSRMKTVQLNYLMARGFTEEDASSLIVNGFIDIFTRELPMEYAVELNRLISLKMEGSVG